MPRRSEAWWSRELVTEQEDLLSAFSGMHAHVGSAVVPEGKGGSLLDRRENPPLQTALEGYPQILGPLEQPPHHVFLSDVHSRVGATHLCHVAGLERTGVCRDESFQHLYSPVGRNRG